ncbi:hypothetical protein [Leifsonia sp. NPDC080035]|uniref:Uncharacterized protein n=1 Tax=Leifsonia sp. NPDC080035 TaxID=3143936 RepID=A0AAU7G9D1_9MICO
MRWFGAGRAQPEPESVLREDDSLGVLALLAVLDEAVANADRAEGLLERCSSGQRLGAADARAGLALRVAFTQLSRWIEGMPCPGDQLLLRDHAACLIRYYLLMVSTALDATFVPSGSRHIAIRGGRPESGTAATALTALRDELREAAT